MASEARVPPLRRNRRPVVDETGRVHPSLTEAAIANNLSLTHAWTRARLQRGGWRFLDEPLRHPSPAPTER
jgi:hypothetical protein